jgi:type IV secretion system protein VirB11
MNFAPLPHTDDRTSPSHANGVVTVAASPKPLGSVRAEIIDTSALDLTLRALRPLLKDDVTELCINSPREAFIETSTGWRREALPFADFSWCKRLAKLVAHATRQRVDETSPLLSAWLPSGERVQIVLPPATSADCVVITIRRPSETVWSLDELAQRGLFARTQRATTELDSTEEELLELLSKEDHKAFVRKAVRARLNILVSGPTGAGKTTFAKAIVREIPSDERLVVIEDTKELVLDSHANHVRLFYSKGEQGLAKVKPTELLEACLRLRPDRILLAELRGSEAYEYLRNVNSGHPGTITSVHAASAELAFEQLVLLVKQSPGGRDLSREDIKQLLYLLVDVVIQFGVERQHRFVKEIWYDPHRKRSAFAASR